MIECTKPLFERIARVTSGPTSECYQPLLVLGPAMRGSNWFVWGDGISYFSFLRSFKRASTLRKMSIAANTTAMIWRMVRKSIMVRAPFSDGSLSLGRMAA